jgi:hypothetical protein
MITTGQAGATVAGFARQVMENSGIQIIVIDGTELRRIIKAPWRLIEYLNSQAQSAMALKRRQLKH